MCNSFCLAQMGGIPLSVSGPNGINGPDSVGVQADQSQLDSINGTNPNVGNSVTPNNATTTTTTTTPTPENDDVEGSGDDEDEDETVDGDGDGDTRDELTSLLDLGSFITRAALFRRRRRSVEPILHEPIKHERQSRQYYSTCNDRITLPCIIEDFISVGSGSIPTCSPIHCGNSLCSSNVSPCRVESTVTPFGIGIHFGDGINKGNAEENIGACIKYKQLTCI